MFAVCRLPSLPTYELSSHTLFAPHLLSKSVSAVSVPNLFLSSSSISLLFYSMCMYVINICPYARDVLLPADAEAEESVRERLGREVWKKTTDVVVDVKPSTK